jgi:uncharacterized protein YkwD
MNWIDLIIIVIVITFALEGQRRGFFVQVFNIIGFLFSLILALTFYSQAAGILIKLFNLPQIATNPISFLIIWVVAESIFFGIFNGIFSKFIEKYNKNTINKTLGFLPAVANALLFLAFILLFIVSLPIKPDIKKDVFDSNIGSILVKKATALERPLNNVFGPIAKQGLTFLTVKPEEHGSLDLRFTQSVVTFDHESEKIMLGLINTEREKAGVRKLIWDEARAEVGRKHSKDMFKRGYFSHYSPEGKDVGDRLEAVGTEYSFAGENLALAPNVDRAHIGLMNSEGHKRNILDPVFGKIGIGVIDGGVYGKMFTQVFTE